MMLDEPYRWADAVSNRREYIEDQLRGGSPVVGLGYKGGALLLVVEHPFCVSIVPQSVVLLKVT